MAFHAVSRGFRPINASDNETDGSATISDGNLTLDGSAQPETWGPQVHWFGRSGRWYAGVDVANTLKSRDLVAVGRSFTFDFDDGATTSGSPTLTSASQGGFASSMVGAALSGSGIPANTTVASVESATSLTMSANATATASSVRISVAQSGSHAEMYCRHRGRLATTFGFGLTPPSGNYRMQITASDLETAMGSVRIRTAPSQTGHLLAFTSSAGESSLKQYLTSDYHWRGDTQGMNVQADATNERSIVIKDSGKTASYGFTHTSGTARFRYITGAKDFLTFEQDGGLQHSSTKIGFYSASPVTKPAVTGSRGGNAALASLLSALASLGLVTDSSSA